VATWCTTLRLFAPSIALLLAVVAAPLSAQPQNVTVVVLNAQDQPPKPVKAVRVKLSYLDSGAVVTDAQQVTNSEGEALLIVSPSVLQRGDLRIEVIGAADLVIWQPADGQLPALGSRVRIALLPKGSPALLGPAQIEAMLHRSLLQLSSLQKENSVLKTATAAAQKQKQDLGAALRAWAESNGFAQSNVDQQVQQWAQGVQQDSAHATAEQRAFAQIALRHYAEAAALFDKAAEANHAELDAEDAEEQDLLNRVRDHLRQLISDRQQSASAWQLNLQYQQATQTLESALAVAAVEDKKHPDDNSFHALWLQTLLATANARRQEAWIAPAERAVTLISQAVTDFKTAAREFSALHDPQGEATAQAGLGNALVVQATHVSRDQAIAQLEQAIQALQQALTVRTRQFSPGEWAGLQSNLGAALTSEGEIVRGDKSAILFSQAVQSFRNSLEVRTQSDAPLDWAATQANLGYTLMQQALRAGAADAPGLLQQAIDADLNALRVRTKTGQPDDWGLTQNNLGLALFHEAEHVSEQQSRILLEQAVDAFRDSLEVFTFAGVPQNWAVAQNNLGNVYWLEGERAPTDQAAALYQQAVQAYRNTLLARTKEASPQSWAMTMVNIALILDREGEREPDAAKAVAVFEQAADNVRQALEVFDKEHFPQYWARTKTNLAELLKDEAERLDGSQADALFDQAVAAYQQSLEVRTRAELPQDWAQSQGGLATLLLEYGERAQGNKSTALLRQSAAAWGNALQVFTQSAFPEDWVEMHLGLEETAFAAADSAACLHEAALLPDKLLSSTQLLVRDILRLACQSSAKDWAAAGQTEKTLLSEAGAAPFAFSDLTGATAVLSRSPAYIESRPSWINLFSAVENGDSAGISAALHQLELLLKP